MSERDSEALWRQAQRLIEQGQTEQAEALAEAAARAGHALARYHCGIARCYADRNASDREEGLEWLQSAESDGVAAASYELAQLALSEVLVPLDWQQISARMQRAAQARFPLALRTYALALARSGAETDLGNLCLEHAAMGGDVVSLALLGERLAEGSDSAGVDRAQAIACLLQDSGLPVAPATRDMPAELAAPEHLAALPMLPLLDMKDCDRTQPTRIALHNDPLVQIADAFLSREECRLVQMLGGPHLAPSITADPQGRLIKSALRTSHDALLTPDREDFWLRMIQRRMVAAAGLSLAQAEEMVLLRYQPGQEYRAHRDYLPPNLIEPLVEGGSGQRQATAIVYLNEDMRGGATAFPLLGLRVEPRMGRLLLFRNLDAQGEPDPRTLHAGEAVESGSKWICTLWIRQGRVRGA